MLVLDIFSFPWLKLASFVAFDNYSHHFQVLPQIFMTGPGIDKLMRMEKSFKIKYMYIRFLLFHNYVNTSSKIYHNI